MLRYDLGQREDKNWIITETAFDSKYLGKCETIMSTGNGYLGLRSCHEEAYPKEVRNLLVNGTFNSAFDNEVTELPNSADVTGLDIEINGENFSLDRGEIVDYSRELHIKTGEVIRKILWISPKGDKVYFLFKRFVSLNCLHLIGQKVEIIAKNSDLKIKVLSGINGKVSNSGSQHFIEGEKRLFDDEYIQLNQTTNKTNIDFVLNTKHFLYLNEEGYEPESKVLKIERRKIGFEYNLVVNKGDRLVIEKISNVYTSRDREIENSNVKIQDYALEEIKKYAAIGYDELIEESKIKWHEVWEKYDVVIDSENDFDQIAIRFAIYHLILMTPQHDFRMGIGAKGLSGEGYRGHTFWDTEIFILPFWIYNNPEAAKNLLIYRYLTLKGAHKKAEGNGYKGAQFPWESAWLDDGEVTPDWGEIDVVSGKQDKVLTGYKEIHVTADVAYAVWHYYMITKDEEFMKDYGYELIFDTAIFWKSRLEWNEKKRNYQILDVIGPDEYKVGVDNNTYTNYLACWNIKKAIEYYDYIKENKQEIFKILDKKLDLTSQYKEWNEVVGDIYLPGPRENGIIPQDDTFLTLPEIDLTKYKEQAHVQGIFDDYNMDQISLIQVMKQADLVTLFYLFENSFNDKAVRENFEYYEKRCLHDSSLSLCTHSIIANDLDYDTLAYSLFEDATKIDLGSDMKSSDAGVHTASIGGIWQCIINGFVGVRLAQGQLRIEPKLPSSWKALSFNMKWHGDSLKLNINNDKLIIVNETKKNEEIKIFNNDKMYILKNKLEINL